MKVGGRVVETFLCITIPSEKTAKNNFRVKGELVFILTKHVSFRDITEISWSFSLRAATNARTSGRNA